MHDRRAAGFIAKGHVNVLHMPSVRSLGRSLLIGSIGGGLFYIFNIPLPWMLGSLIANLIASLSSLNIGMPTRVRDMALGIMGLILGSRVSPDLIYRAADWPLSLILLLVGVATSTCCVALWYRRCGFGSTTALLSALPGGMAALIMMAHKLKADPQTVAIGQSLRIVFVIVILVPLIWFFGEGGEVVDRSPTPRTFQDGWLLLLLPAIIYFGERARIPAAAFLPPMVISALFSIFSVASFQVPEWSLAVLMVVIGSSIGAGFSGISVKKLMRYSGYGLIATVIAISILALFAEIIHQLLGVERAAAMLALAPGGITEMAVLAVVLNMDPVFVIFHQLVRVIALTAMAPFLVASLKQHSETN